MERRMRSTPQYDGIWPQAWAWRVFLLLSWFLVTPLVGIAVGLWRLIVGARTTAWARGIFLGLTLIVVAAAAAGGGFVGGMAVGDDGVTADVVVEAVNAARDEAHAQGYDDGYGHGYEDGLAADTGQRDLCWNLADELVKAGNAAGPQIAEWCDRTFGGR